MAHLQTILCIVLGSVYLAFFFFCETNTFTARHYFDEVYNICVEFSPFLSRVTETQMRVLHAVTEAIIYSVGER